MPPSAPIAVAAYLLGTVDFDSAVRLQQRLVFEASEGRPDPLALLVCEHAPLITIGRQGSRADVQVESAELERRRIDVRHMGRGGGAILHAPGQLALYPIVPLEQLGWSVGEYVRRLESGLLAALHDLKVTATQRPGRRGIWGRTGLLATIATAVRCGTTFFGAYVNVDGAAGLTRRVLTDPLERAPMSSLVAERQGRIRMATAREALVRSLATSLGDGRYHCFSRHPLLVRAPAPAATSSQPLPESPARAG